MKYSSTEFHHEHQLLRIVVLIILMTALAVTWYLLTIRMKIGFWSAGDDYTQHSLAHAINIEHWVTEGGRRSVGYFQTIHPGIPFQIVSWIALRAAALFYPANTGDPISYTLWNPELFWLANQFSAFLLTIVGLVGVWWLSRRLGLGIALAALIIFFAGGITWTYGLLRLGNESFALPLSIVFFGVSQRAFQTRSTKLLLWAALGALGGITYLVKLNYIVWFISGGMGLFTQLLMRSIDVRQFIRSIGYYLLGFCCIVFAVGTFFLRSKGLRQMINQHWAVFSHTGYYGEGQGGLVAWDSMLHAFQNIMAAPKLWVASALLLILIGGTLFWRRTDREWLGKNLPFAVCLLSAIVLGYAAVIKHFHIHYLVPTVAVQPMVILWLGKSLGRRIGYVIAIVVIITAIITGVNQFQQRSLALDSAKAMQNNLDNIYGFPIGNRQIRLWSYRVNTAPYLVNFVVEMAEIVGLYGEPAKMYPQDADYNIWVKKVFWQGTWFECSEIPWQYAIFNRRNFPTFKSLPTYFQQNGTEVSGFDKTLIVIRTNP